MKEDKERPMRIEKILKHLLTALYCGDKLENSYKKEKEEEKYKKLETTVISLVSTKVVLIAFVI